MGRKALEKISQREYGRRIGVSNEAVSKAVREGKIKKGWDSKEGKIIVEHANAEWGSIHMQANVEKLLENKPFNSNFMPRPIGSGLTLNGDSSYADAKRVREILQAQLVAIELKKVKGELVDKEEVYKQLFAYGQQIRTVFTSIPDRNIDMILAAKSRAEAHSLLTTAMYEALEAITTREFNFIPPQQ